MEPEIIYRYVKGKGWVPESPDPVTDDNDIFTRITTRNGRLYRLTILNRRPNVGERAWQIQRGESLSHTYSDIVDMDVPTYGWRVNHQLDLDERRFYVTVITERL